MDFKKNRLPIAGAAFALLLGVAIYASRHQYDAPRSESSALPTLPTIDPEAVTSLTLSREGQPTVTLTREGTTWKVTEPLEAAADASAIRTALTRLSDLEVVRVAASRAENHERLGVDDAHALHVTAKQGEEAVLDLLVGSAGSGSTMVRLPGEDRVLALQGSLTYALDKPLKDWRERVILSFAPEAVSALRLASEEGTFAFTKAAGEEAFAPTEDTPAIERFDANRVRSLVTTIARLRASDFAAPDAPAESLGLSAPWATVTVTTIAEAPAEPPAEGEVPAAPAAPTEHVIRVGAPAPGGRYLQVEGNPVVFVVSDPVAARLHPDASAFSAPEPGTEPPEAAGMPPGMGMGMGGGPGGQQLPPELLRQLQQQLGQAGH